MRCSFRCHCGNDLIDDRSTRLGHCYDCDGGTGGCQKCNKETTAQPNPKEVAEHPDRVDLDHPCKNTCSGWKHGYERGREQDSRRCADLDAQLNYERMENYKQDKQIAELTAELSHCKEALGMSSKRNGQLSDENRELRAERDKFKAALEKIASQTLDEEPPFRYAPKYEFHKIAREALGQTDGEIEVKG